MAVTQDLIDFVRTGLATGMSRAEIEAVLRKAGWSRPQLDEALGAFADVESPIPVPRPRPYVSAREAFTYLVLFVTLYLGAYSFGSLVFDVIETTFPDPASRRSAAMMAESVRWATAALIVVFPLFLFVASRVERAVRLDPAQRLSKIRRQLTYVTLFVASCVLIGDVTTLVYFALGGDLTVSFVLKVLAVAAIAMAAFGYCVQDTVGEQAEPARGRNRVLAVAATACVALALLLGARVIGSPANAREARIDENRVRALNGITYAVDLYVGRSGRLPEDLRALSDVSRVRLTDPATGAPFEYRVRGEKAYELCGVFARPTPAEGGSSFWWHEAGRQCFGLTVRDPQPRR